MHSIIIGLENVAKVASLTADDAEMVVNFFDGKKSRKATVQITRMSVAIYIDIGSTRDLSLDELRALSSRLIASESLIVAARKFQSVGTL